MKRKLHSIQIDLILDEEEIGKLARLVKAKERRYGTEESLKFMAETIAQSYFAETLDRLLELYEGLPPLKGIRKETGDAGD